MKQSAPSMQMTELSHFRPITRKSYISQCSELTESYNDGEHDSVSEHDFENINWPDAARRLDTFLFFTFLVGQLMVSLVFLIPMSTGTT